MSDHYKPNYKRDVIDEAQSVLNSNKSLESKNLISLLVNEIVALRWEVSRLEDKSVTGPGTVKSLLVKFDRDGKVEFVESTNHG